MRAGGASRSFGLRIRGGVPPHAAGGAVDPSVRLITEGLMKAIKAEHDGHYFYLGVAERTQDPQGKAAFTFLAEEEKAHMDFLRAQYRSYQERGQADPSVTLGTAREWGEASPIFSPEFKKRLGDAHYEMSALSLGILLEQNSVAFYESQAHAVEDPAAKDFFLGLARWERGHLQALLRQEEALKEEYWQQAGFAPF